MGNRLLIGLAVLALGAASCADSAAPTTTAAVTGTTIPTTTTAATTSSLVPTTTTAPTTTQTPTTTTAPTTTTTEPALAAVPALEDGRPSTFLAVTDDYAAVEVDTLSGAVVTEFGQMSSRREVDESADPEFEIVIDSIWRSTDGQWIVISECCEPAAGTIHYLGPGETLTPENHDDSLTSFGWLVAPSPVSGEIAVLGYSLSVGEVGDERYGDQIDQGADFPEGMPAWSRDGQTVYWLGSVFDAPNLLNSVTLGGGDPVRTSTPLEWLGPDGRLEGLGMQASERLVAFQHFDDETTRGVVFTTDGELATEFAVEDGSTFGGYDPTGRFLIYVDRDGRVRWQGLGRSGELGSGYLFASW